MNSPQIHVRQNLSSASELLHLQRDVHRVRKGYPVVHLEILIGTKT